MYYPEGMKARVSPVQSIEPHRILAPTRDVNRRSCSGRYITPARTTRQTKPLLYAQNIFSDFSKLYQLIFIRTCFYSKVLNDWQRDSYICCSCVRRACLSTSRKTRPSSASRHEAHCHWTIVAVTNIFFRQQFPLDFERTGRHSVIRLHHSKRNHRYLGTRNPRFNIWHERSVLSKTPNSSDNRMIIPNNYTRLDWA